MHILIAAPFVPRVDAGHAGGVVLWRVVQVLAAHHTLSLVAFVSDEAEGRGRRHLEPLLDHGVSVRAVYHPLASVASDFLLHPGRRARSLLLSRLPYSVWRLRSRKMTDAISAALNETTFDIAQVEFTSMGQYVDALKTGPRTVFRKHDLAMIHYERRVRTEDILWRKAYHYVQWRRMRRYELAVCRRFDRVIVPSSPAKVQLLAESPDLDVDVVPFGVTLPDVPAPAGPIESSEEKRILFVGSMGRPLNVEAVLYFCEEVWPRIRRQEPDAEFWIVGSDPPPRIRQLTHAHPQVKVTGFVDDLTPEYARASVVVVPLLVGGGVITKILDAMAMSKAIVTTSIANEGIAASPGRDVVIADQPDRFAQEVVDLLRDPERRQRLGRNARRFVEERFSWPGIVERFERIYEAMLLEY